MTITTETDSHHAARICAAALFVATTGLALVGAPSRAAAVLLDEMSPQSWWAIGGPGNCNNAHNFYSFERGDGFIRWQNGEGNVDVEGIDYSFESEFHTTTTNSRHVSGRNEPVGQGWTYVRMGANLVRVIPGGRSAFLLVRCQ